MRKINFVLSTIIIYIVVIAGGVVGAAWWYESHNSSIASNASDATLTNVTTQEAFNPVAPIEIEEVQYFEDGGTTGVSMTDADGRSFSFCLDGRLRLQNADMNEPYYLYIDSTYPTDSNAVKVAVGGGTEAKVLLLLQDWVERNVSEDKESELTNAEIRTDWTEEDWNIWRIIHVIETLSKRAS